MNGFQASTRANGPLPTNLRDLTALLHFLTSSHNDVSFRPLDEDFQALSRPWSGPHLLHRKGCISSRVSEAPGFVLGYCSHDCFWHFLTLWCPLWLGHGGDQCIRKHSFFREHRISFWNGLQSLLHLAIRKNSPPPQTLIFHVACLFIQSVTMVHLDPLLKPFSSTFTDTSRMMFDHRPGHHGPAQLTHKITGRDNCEIVPEVFLGPLLWSLWHLLLLPSEHTWMMIRMTASVNNGESAWLCSLCDPPLRTLLSPFYSWKSCWPMLTCTNACSISLYFQRGCGNTLPSLSSIPPSSWSQPLMTQKQSLPECLSLIP